MFVPASELCDPATGTRLVHPAKQASDASVWHAVEMVDPQGLALSRARYRR